MPTDNTDKLDVLDKAIESGVTSTSADGHSASQDLQHLQKVRRDLRLNDTDSIAAGRVRPTIVGLNLGGAW